MPRIVPTRRTVASVLLTGLLAGSVLQSSPQAVAATATADPDPTSAYSVVPGIRLQAKPPPWVLPVTGYHLTGRFGQTSGLWARSHTGLDFAAPQGVGIRSIAPGVVMAASYDGSFGNKTVVRLEDGTDLWYCHQSSFAVEVGQRVAAGDLIGRVGSTGNVTGPHLHLEVHPGGHGAVDPEAWLPRHRLRL